MQQPVFAGARSVEWIDTPLDGASSATFDPLDIAEIASFDAAVTGFTDPFTELVQGRSR